MEQKLKEKWVAALRSGKYKQGKEYLRSDEEGGTQYCCLGVLCEVTPGIKWDGGGNYRLTTKKLASLFDEDTFYDEIVVIEDEELPEPLVKYFGMDKATRVNKTDSDVHGKLINMNDSGKSFDQIANYIEKHL